MSEADTEQKTASATSVRVQGIVMYPYHCVLCGTQLHEGRFGILECGGCKVQFLPTGNGENTFSVTWGA